MKRDTKILGILIASYDHSTKARPTLSLLWWASSKAWRYILILILIYIDIYIDIFPCDSSKPRILLQAFNFILKKNDFGFAFSQCHLQKQNLIMFLSFKSVKQLVLVFPFHPTIFLSCYIFKDKKLPPFHICPALQFHFPLPRHLVKKRISFCRFWW